MADNKRLKATRGKNKTKKKAARKAVAASAKPKQSKRRHVAGKKVRPAAKKKRSARKAAKETQSSEPSTLGGKIFASAHPGRSRIGSRSAGQSGDLQGLPRKAVVDSESVEELIEEGQAREAAAISGVEDALDPDQSEVHTREVPEDDVPEEYTDED